MGLQVSVVRRRDERGVSAVIFALMLTALLGVSAFAVDLGQGYAERRHDQNTVDAAVMSGLVVGLLDGGSVDGIVDEVRAKVDVTLNRTVSDDEWLACSDDEQLYFNTRELQLANPVISPVTDCISFSRKFDELRVKLPGQTVPGVIAPALGLGDLVTSASANGRISDGTGGLPFVALATASHGDFVCLRTSSAKQPLPLANGNGPGVPATFPLAGAVGARSDPCDDNVFNPDSQRFGTLKPFAYSDCTQQNTDWEVAIAIGIDHPMGVFPEGYMESPPPPPADGPDPYEVRYDGAPFTGASGARCQSAYPNTFEIDEGLNSGGLSCALLRNADTLCNDVTPRLNQGLAATQSFALLGKTYFDNSTPWQFLRPAEELYAEGSPEECVWLAASRTTDDFDPTSADPPLSSYHAVTSYDIYGDPLTYGDIAMSDKTDGNWDQYDRFDAMVRCLKKWGQETAPGSGVNYPTNQLFEDEIGTSARFGFVPQVHEQNLNVTYVHIEGFLPVFLYRVYIQRNAKMCDPADPRSTGLLVHDAGQTYTCGLYKDTIDRLASVIFACNMFSKEICSKPSELPASSGKDIYDFRLSK